VLAEREFIEAVLWLARTGSPWRDLPGVFGKWYAVHTRFQRWKKRGVWHKLWQILQREEFAVATKLFIDSTTVRAHQHAAGAPKKTVAIKLWGALGVG
jgi:transposase